MTHTVAEARGDSKADMHCGKGHKFTLYEAYRDDHGTWCPECGDGAHSSYVKYCAFCKPCTSCAKLRSLDTGKCSECWKTIKLSENLEPIPDYGDLLTIKEFLENVKSGTFIDYDGYGHWATATHILSGENVYPSACKGLNVKSPPRATHVVWFNR